MITKELAKQAKNQVQDEFMKKEYGHGIAIGSNTNEDGAISYSVTMFSSDIIHAQQDFGDTIEVASHEMRHPARSTLSIDGPVNGGIHMVPIKYVQMGMFKPEEIK